MTSSRASIDTVVRLVTSRFHLFVSHGIDMFDNYDEDTNLLELPCFKRATEITYHLRQHGDPAGAGRRRQANVCTADEASLIGDCHHRWRGRVRISARSCRRAVLACRSSSLSASTPAWESSPSTPAHSWPYSSCLSMICNGWKWMQPISQRCKWRIASSLNWRTRPCHSRCRRWRSSARKAAALRRSSWSGKPDASRSAYSSSIDTSSKHFSRILELFSSTCTDVPQIKFPIKPVCVSHLFILYADDFNYINLVRLLLACSCRLIKSEMRINIWI